MEFYKDEMYLMMLYSPGTKSGLVEVLKQMKMQLTPEKTELCSMTDSTLAKLEVMTDEEFERLNLVISADSLIGHGTALRAVWNGVPAL